MSSDDTEFQAPTSGSLGDPTPRPVPRSAPPADDWASQVSPPTYGSMPPVSGGQGLPVERSVPFRPLSEYPAEPQVNPGPRPDTVLVPRDELYHLWDSMISVESKAANAAESGNLEFARNEAREAADIMYDAVETIKEIAGRPSYVAEQPVLHRPVRRHQPSDSRWAPDPRTRPAQPPVRREEPSENEKKPVNRAKFGMALDVVLGIVLGFILGSILKNNVLADGFDWQIGSGGITVLWYAAFVFVGIILGKLAVRPARKFVIDLFKD